MAGAPTVRTEENEKIILDAVRLGLSYRSACEAAGICESTFMCWKREDSQFMHRIKRAEQEGKLERPRQISHQTYADWRAGAWILSHRYPDEFSEKRIIETRGGEPSPYDRLIEALDKAEARDEEKENTE